MTEVQMGIYRHYGGGLYQVLGIAHDANAEDLYWAADGFYESPGSGSRLADGASALGKRTVVVYLPLQLDVAHLGPRLAVRTLEDFLVIVCATPSCSGYGSTLSHGRVFSMGRNEHVLAQRFTYLGQELTEEMLKESAPVGNSFVTMSPVVADQPDMNQSNPPPQTGPEEMTVVETHQAVGATAPQTTSVITTEERLLYAVKRMRDDYASVHPLDQSWTSRPQVVLRLDAIIALFGEKPS